MLQPDEHTLRPFYFWNRAAQNFEEYVPFFLETLDYQSGISTRAPASFPLRGLGIVMIYWAVSIDQPMTVLLVIYCALPSPVSSNKLVFPLPLLVDCWYGITKR